MKPSEFAKVQEGILDTIKQSFAKSGALGAGAQKSAFTRELEKEKAESSRLVDKEKLQQWLIDLPVAIAKAFQAGLITSPTPIPESSFVSIKYKNFNRLIENVMLNEAMSYNDFIKQYANKIALSLDIPMSPALQTAIDTNIADFITKFNYTPGLAPEKHRLSEPAKQSAVKIWNTIMQGKNLRADTTSTVGSKFGSPKTDYDVEINGIDYHYDVAAQQWSTNGTAITDEDDIDKLNREAYNKIKKTPKTPVAAPLPTDDVPEDRTAGALWTPDGAKNSYSFNKNTKVWMMHRPAPTGSTSLPLPVQIKDPKTIEKLNKIWADQGETLE